MSTTTYVFVEKYEKYQYFWVDKIALSGAIMILFSDGIDPILKDTQKGWVSAIQTAPMYQCDPAYPEPYLRRTDLRVHDPYTSMPFSDAIFKEKCRSRYVTSFNLSMLSKSSADDILKYIFLRKL